MALFAYWRRMGGEGANGVGADRAAAPVGITRIDGTSAFYDWDITALVQHWLWDQPSADPALAGVEDNHGLVLAPEASNPASEFGFYSSEYRQIDGVQQESSLCWAPHQANRARHRHFRTHRNWCTGANSYLVAYHRSRHAGRRAGRGQRKDHDRHLHQRVGPFDQLWRNGTSTCAQPYDRDRAPSTALAPAGRCAVNAVVTVRSCASARRLTRWPRWNSAHTPDSPVGRGRVHLGKEHVRAPWSLPGADDVALDRTQTPISTCIVDGPSSCYTWDITSLVAYWLSLDPASGEDPSLSRHQRQLWPDAPGDGGSPAGECRFYSSEYLSEPNVQPVFEIIYELPEPTVTATPSPSPTATDMPSPTASLAAPAGLSLSVPLVMQSR